MDPLRGGPNEFGPLFSKKSLCIIITYGSAGKNLTPTREGGGKNSDPSRGGMEKNLLGENPLPSVVKKCPLPYLKALFMGE